MPANPQYLKKWNGLSGLPVADMQKDYYWPANVNAALAAINRALFTGASVADKAAIDSLENALTESFLGKESQTKIEASVAFGKAVAAAVYNWSETDGYRDAYNPYTPPIGDGMWEPTSPKSPGDLSPGLVNPGIRRSRTSFVLVCASWALHSPPL